MNWYQQALTPPHVLELNVRIGAIPDEDHMQALVELKDPVSGVMIGQWSYPHAGLRDADAVIGWAFKRAMEVFAEHAEPF